MKGRQFYVAVKNGELPETAVFDPCHFCGAQRVTWDCQVCGATSEEEARYEYEQDKKWAEEYVEYEGSWE